VQRLKTRAQYEAAMAGGTVSRTPHFVLHRAALDAPSQPTGPETPRAQALFAVREASIGAVVPKRWAKRAVTRNGIKRQIYTLSAQFEPRLAHTAHVVRLRTGFAREQFESAWSEPLKKAVRAELLQLFEKLVVPAPAVIPAQAGIQDPASPGVPS
jgi:ribonuclease P protein component